MSIGNVGIADPIVLGSYETQKDRDTKNAELLKEVSRETLLTWRSGAKKEFTKAEKDQLDHLRDGLSVGFLNRLGIKLLRVHSAFNGSLDRNYYHDLAMRIGGFGCEYRKIFAVAATPVSPSKVKKQYQYADSTIRDTQLQEVYEIAAKLAGGKAIYSKNGVLAIDEKGTVVNGLALPMEMFDQAFKVLQERRGEKPLIRSESMPVLSGSKKEMPPLKRAASTPQPLSKKEIAKKEKEEASLVFLRAFMREML